VLNQAITIYRREGLFVSVAALIVSQFCLSAKSFAACEHRSIRTHGEYAISVGAAGTVHQQGTAVFGPGLGIFVNPRVEVEGDLLFTPQASIGGTALISVLPFRGRDAFSTGCLIGYLSAGGAGDSDYLYEGPGGGGGFKYYYRGGLGLDVRFIAVAPVPNSGAVFKGTVGMLTLRLVFEPN